MNIRSSMITLVASGFLAATLPAPVSAVDPAPRCESFKLRAAGKFKQCRLTAESKALRKGEAADYSKCDAKLTDGWGKAESKAGPGVCPSEADLEEVRGEIAGYTDAIAVALSGEETGPSCDGPSVDLSGRNFTSALFHNVDLTCATLQGTNLNGSEWTGATLVGADLSRGSGSDDATVSTFVSADLTGADFTDRSLAGANMHMAILDGVTWSNTTCQDGTNSDTNGGTCCGHHVGMAIPASCTP